MSKALKIGFLIAFVIVGFVLSYQEKVTWIEFIGSLAILNSGILAFEKFIEKKQL